MSRYVATLRVAFDSRDDVDRAMGVLDSVALDGELARESYWEESE